MSDLEASRVRAQKSERSGNAAQRFFSKPPRRAARNAPLLLCYTLTAVACVLSVPLACAFGSLSLPVGDVLQALAAKVTGTALSSGTVAVTPDGLQQAVDAETMVLVAGDLRLPRVLLALFTGMGLALAGTVFQGILRNPLADPFTLGVSGGAAFGAALAISLGLGSALGGLGVSLSAFAGAGAALAAVLLLGSLGAGEENKGRGLERETLVLAGVVVSAFLAALIALLKALDESSVSGIVFWIMGSFQGRGWAEVSLALPGIALGSALALACSRDLDIMSLGDTTARGLGLNAGKSRLLLLAAASAVTASCVAVAGIIGFIGLIIPHLCRLLLGARHAFVLPASALGGGLLLLWSDVAARTLLPRGVELPVGVITALLGGPFFCYLLVRSRTALPGRKLLPAEVVPVDGPDADGMQGGRPSTLSGGCGQSFPRIAPVCGARLEVRHVSLRYRGREEEAVHDISFTLEPGERAALLGPNGSGKSTLLHCISGIIAPGRGSVSLGGRNVQSLGGKKRAKCMALVPQRPENIPALSAWQLTLMGRYAHSGTWTGYSYKDRLIAARALAAAGGGHMALRNAQSLSGGELQRVFLARALAQEAPLLLLDEPTSGLDPAMQTMAMEILARTLDGCTVLAAMHDINLAAMYCNRILLVKQGKLVADGPTEDIFTQALLEEVYETPVILLRHPENGRPQALLQGTCGTGSKGAT